MLNANKQFGATLAAVGSGGFGFGIVLPVTSVVLERMQVATPLIGLMATAMFAGLALGGPLAGRLIELWGLRRTLATGLTVCALAMFCLGALVSGACLLLCLFFFFGPPVLSEILGTSSNIGFAIGLFFGISASLSLMILPLWLVRRRIPRLAE